MEPKKRGRPKGSGKKENWGPFNPDNLQKEFDEAFKNPPIEETGNKYYIDVANKVILKETQDGIVNISETHLPEKPTILNGPVFDQGKLQKRLNELRNHEPLAFEETPFPDNWDKMGKVERLKWLKNNKL